MFAKAKIVREDLFSTPLTFVLFSASFFVQIDQGAITFILHCSMLKSIGEFMCFQGACVLSVKSLLQQLMQSISHEAVLLLDASIGSMIHFQIIQEIEVH